MGRICILIRVSHFPLLYFALLYLVYYSTIPESTPGGKEAVERKEMEMEAEAEANKKRNVIHRSTIWPLGRANTARSLVTGERDHDAVFWGREC